MWCVCVFVKAQVSSCCLDLGKIICAICICNFLFFLTCRMLNICLSLLVFKLNLFSVSVTPYKCVLRLDAPVRCYLCPESSPCRCHSCQWQHTHTCSPHDRWCTERSSVCVFACCAAGQLLDPSTLIWLGEPTGSRQLVSCWATEPNERLFYLARRPGARWNTKNATCSFLWHTNFWLPA